MTIRSPGQSSADKPPVMAAVACLAAAVWSLTGATDIGVWAFEVLPLGLGIVLPPEYTIMMWIGSAFFTIMERRYVQRVGEFGHRLWVDGREAVCAGIIAGWALLGVGNGIVEAFVTIPQDAQQAAAMEPAAPDAVPATPNVPAPAPGG
jgi:uncharacterized oligopeptide transporter (OPT) family protein